MNVKGVPTQKSMTNIFCDDVFQI